MHNDLVLVEARIERELRERVLPAVYSDRDAADRCGVGRCRVSRSRSTTP